jgi:ankyrin repeat protein
MTFKEGHKLIKKGDAVSLRHALDEGVSPNLANQFSWTLLMLAALEGNMIIGELLISRGAILDTTNDFGETALSLAAHAGHLPFIRLLLANGASMNCHPHGHSLEDWIRFTSGLPKDKIESVLALLTRDDNSRNPAEHLQ